VYQLRSPKSKTSDQQKRLTALVVQNYRQRLGSAKKTLPFVQFAHQLNAFAEIVGLSVSYQSIKNWEDGIHRPDYFFTLQIANHAPEGSWQRAFAMDLLAVQWPMLYEPGSEIGERYTKELLQNQ
jgi:hypothetical protein